jgi:hypothetical protein
VWFYFKHTCIFLLLFLGENRLLASPCLPIRPSASNNSAPTERIFMPKFDIWVFFKILPRKLKFRWSLKRITGIVLEDVRTFITISRLVLLRMRNVSEKKNCRENQNTHLVFSIFFFENRAVFEIMWKNIVQPYRPQMTIQYGAYALHAVYLRLQTQTHNM